MVGESHPTIREFQKEEADTSVMFAELDIGRKIKQPQRQKYKRINLRLQTLAGGYQQYSPITAKGTLAERK